jgi:hypothetical protein
MVFEKFAPLTVSTNAPAPAVADGGLSEARLTTAGVWVVPGVLVAVGVGV